MNTPVCPRCGKVLIQEELASHECFFSVKSVEIEYYFEVKDTEEDTLVVKTKNGDFIRLIKSKLPASDGTLQEDYAEWLRRRLDRTSSSVTPASATDT
jgi:hypothetical protein